MTISTTEMKTQLTQYRDEASEIQRSFAAEREAIQNDRMRSDFAKQEDLATARDTANARIKDAQSRENAYLASAREKLEKAAFGIGSAPDTADIVAMRDAADRVENVTDEDQAVAMYERAKQIGDKTMIAALASRAHRAGMPKVLDLHKQNNPADASHFESLQFLAGLDSIAAQLQAAMLYSSVGGRY